MIEDKQDVAVRERAPGDSRRLAGQIRSMGELDVEDKDRMFVLFSRYFRDVDRAGFERDLEEKEGCVLLRGGRSGRIQGFSTFVRIEKTVGREHLVSVYSGDTIIDHKYWGETELFRVWGRYVYELSENMPHASVYWFLITSGYKTYRFLPIFFREFYPTYTCATPANMQRRLDAFASHKFPTEYDARSGIVRLAGATPLREGVADVTANRLKDPHVAHFVRTNPGYVNGDNLACLAKIDGANLTSAARRMLGR